MSAYQQSPAPDAQRVPPVPPIEPSFPPQQAPHDQKKLRKGWLEARASTIGPAQVVRVILGTVLAVLLMITWIVGSSAINDAGSPSDWSSDLDSASMINDLNNEETDGAPQQAVVNGWYANDLAVIQTSQNTHLAATSARNGNLLLLVGLGIAGELIIRGLERSTRAGTNRKPSHDMNEAR